MKAILRIYENISVLQNNPTLILLKAFVVQVVESQNYNPPSTSSSDRLALKRSSQDLSDMYKCFFPELLDFQVIFIT